MQSTQEIQALGKACDDIAKRQIETWDTRDPEKLRDIYTEDIVHFDSHPAYVGIDQVLDMARMMFRTFPAWEMEAGDTYISQEKCLGTWKNWGVMGFKEENPFLEFDLLETQGNKISFWRLFYDERFRPNDFDLLAIFKNAWSSNDLETLLEVYSENAVLQDTLFGTSIEGRESITDYLQNFLDLSQGGSWTLIQGFSERYVPYKIDYMGPSMGGVFSVNTRKPNGENCDVLVAAILTPDENGKIQSQETFYDANSLIECGWVK
jgi:ketosteroid isomerase-like protein